MRLTLTLSAIIIVARCTLLASLQFVPRDSFLSLALFCILTLLLLGLHLKDNFLSRAHRVMPYLSLGLLVNLPFLIV